MQVVTRPKRCSNPGVTSSSAMSVQRVLLGSDQPGTGGASHQLCWLGGVAYRGQPVAKCALLGFTIGVVPEAPTARDADRAQSKLSCVRRLPVRKLRRHEASGGDAVEEMVLKTWTLVSRFSIML